MPTRAPLPFVVHDLGRLPYAPAYAEQVRLVEAVQAARDTPNDSIGHLILVEHDPPVITVSRRPEARTHLIATPEHLAHHGIEVARTDRGGDITYHGPGQLVAYPIFDLNKATLNLHAYIRLLEQAAIDVCAALGIVARRDPDATGVWVEPTANSAPNSPDDAAKLCAIGVRVRRWITMHGLALNVTTNLDHFKLIVPCGLPGRPVTSLHDILGDACPSMPDVKRLLVDALAQLIARPDAVIQGAGRRARRR